MDADMKRIIEAIEDIEEDDGAMSLVDHDIYEAKQKGLEGSIPGLKEVFSRLQNKRNAKVNNLKFEDGIEIEWDGISIFVKKDGNPYLQRDMFNSGEWKAWTYQFPLIG